MLIKFIEIIILNYSITVPVTWLYFQLLLKPLLQHDVLKHNVRLSIITQCYS